MVNLAQAWQRLWAMIRKEFAQLRRDPGTLGIMIGIPLFQIILFGYAINYNPKHLPVAVVAADHSELTRQFLQGMTNTGYFKLKSVTSEAAATQQLTRGEVQFVLNIPPGFTRDLLRGQRPALLLSVDATDPAATSNALQAVNTLAQNVLLPDLTGALAYLTPTDTPFELRIHAQYNPESITQYNIVPGLMGVVLTLTLVVVTAVAVTRETERGTLEHLLAMPLHPVEIIIGKCVPYIFIGYAQLVLILGIAHSLFHIPMEGSITVLLLASLPFVAANLATGLALSSLAQNQMQAQQLATFFFLPSLLLSGFLFPFRGMPDWAQWIGKLLPLTHFLRITRGILLKDYGWPQVWPELWPILLFFSVAILLAVKFFKRTLA